MSDAEHLIRALARAYPHRPVASVEAFLDEDARLAHDLARHRATYRARAADLFRRIREDQL